MEGDELLHKPTLLCVCVCVCVHIYSLTGTNDECRAEKTEVLSEDDQELERRVELINKISLTMLKRLQACLSSQGVTADAERRMV